MTHPPSSSSFPAPCIIDVGMIINKEDMRRLLNDLGRVRYIHTLEGHLQSEGEGWIVEVFADPLQATLIANHLVYINVQSFDYLKLNRSKGEVHFDLIQDMRQLRLIPLYNSLQEIEGTDNIDADTLEAMVTQVLAAKWDVQLDDEEGCF